MSRPGDIYVLFGLVWFGYIKLSVVWFAFLLRWIIRPETWLSGCAVNFVSVVSLPFFLPVPVLHY